MLTADGVFALSGTLVVDSKVNLERAMAGHGRFGGHFVQVSHRRSRGSTFLASPTLFVISRLLRETTDSDARTGSR